MEIWKDRLDELRIANLNVLHLNLNLLSRQSAIHAHMAHQSNAVASHQLQPKVDSWRRSKGTKLRVSIDTISIDGKLHISNR